MYPLLFVCEGAAAACHPLEAISADSPECVHGGQRCRQQREVGLYRTITTYRIYNHMLCSFSLVCASLCKQKEEQKAAGESCFMHLIF